jgi:protein ImuA
MSPLPALAPTLSEVFAATPPGAAATGFVLARLPPGAAPVLWVQDRLSRRETGRPCPAGLGGRALMLLDLARPVDVLAAVEEGLRCRALLAVVAEIWGDPPVLDFTATKRLAMRAEATGVPCWLVRHAAGVDLSAARDRWRVGTLPSAAHRDDPQAPGAARWQVELFRARDRPPGAWVVCHDHAAAAEAGAEAGPLPGAQRARG